MSNFMEIKQMPKGRLMVDLEEVVGLADVPARTWDDACEEAKKHLPEDAVKAFDSNECCMVLLRGTVAFQMVKESYDTMKAAVMSQIHAQLTTCEDGAVRRPRNTLGSGRGRVPPSQEIT